MNIADMIGQYLKLRDAVAAKQAIVEQDGVSEKDQELLDIVMNSEKRDHSSIHRMCMRFQYLATGMGAYTKAMAAIEGEVSRLMLEQNESSIKTDQGTAYRAAWTAAKVNDREQWMDFLFDGRHEGFITNHVSKEAVKEYIDTYKSVPPGLDVTNGFKTNFRKAGAA